MSNRWGTLICQPPTKFKDIFEINNLQIYTLEYSIVLKWNLAILIEIGYDHKNFLWILSFLRGWFCKTSNPSPLLQFKKYSLQGRLFTSPGYLILQINYLCHLTCSSHEFTYPTSNHSIVLLFASRHRHLLLIFQQSFSQSHTRTHIHTHTPDTVICC